jgi:hypothetical protein
LPCCWNNLSFTKNLSGFIVGGKKKKRMFNVVASDGGRVFYGSTPSEKTVVLQSGDKISASKLKSILQALAGLKQYRFRSVNENDLYRKALNKKYPFAEFPGGPPKIPQELIDLKLVDENQQMDAEVAFVIRNCFKLGQYFGVTRLNPLTGEVLPAIDDCWEKLINSLNN